MLRQTWSLFNLLNGWIDGWMQRPTLLLTFLTRSIVCWYLDCNWAPNLRPFLRLPLIDCVEVIENTLPLLHSEKRLHNVHSRHLSNRTGRYESQHSVTSLMINLWCF